MLLEKYEKGAFPVGKFYQRRKIIFASGKTKDTGLTDDLQWTNLKDVEDHR